MLHLQVSFPSTERGKKNFSSFGTRAKQSHFPDNYRLLSGLLDCLEGREIGGIKTVEDNSSKAAT